MLDTQVEFMVDHDVPRERAEAAIEDLRRNSEHRSNASNYRYNPSVAELLDQP